MHRLAQIHPELLLRLDRRLERALPPLHLVRGLLRAEFVVDDLERAGLLDGAVRRGAVRAIHLLAREGVHGLEEGLTLEVLEIRPSEALEVDAAVGLFEEDTGAGLKFRRLIS